MAATLVLVRKDGRQKGINLRARTVVIGRRPNCDVRIPLMQISRNHCRIVHQGEETVVQDLGSVNGTFVNSHRVMEAVIHAGDLLSVGTVDFAVQIDGQPNEIESSKQPRRPEPISQGEATGAALIEAVEAEPADSPQRPLSSPELGNLPLRGLAPPGELPDTDSSDYQK